MRCLCLKQRIENLPEKCGMKEKGGCWKGGIFYEKCIVSTISHFLAKVSKTLNKSPTPIFELANKQQPNHDI